MFAILGLIGVALSAFVISGTDFGEEAKADEPDFDPLPEDTPPVVSVDILLDDLEEHENLAELTPSDPQTPDERVFGSDAGDTIIVGDTDDFVDTQDGDDTITGGAGDDTLHGGRGDDAVFGGDGDDALQGYLGNDRLIGGNGADVLFGGAGDDVLDGRDQDNSADFLNGSAGDDTLLAGVGDYLNGGTGADLFGLESDSNAYVEDFDPDEDRIEVTFDQDSAAPLIRFEDTDAGAILLADGTIVATFAGHAALDLANVPVTLIPVPSEA
ncbi:MAG: calcium-binding protein [Yoonia sp.]